MKAVALLFLFLLSLARANMRIPVLMTKDGTQVTSTTLVVLLDGSSYVTQNDWALMKENLLNIVALKSAKVSIAIIVFSDNVQIVCGLKDDVAKCNKAVQDAVQPRGKVSTYKALTEVNSLLKLINGDKFVLLLTNAAPEDVQTSIADEIKQQGIKIYCIGNASIPALVSIASDKCFLSVIAMDEVATIIKDSLDPNYYEGMTLKIKLTDKLKTVGFSEPATFTVTIDNTNGKNDIPAKTRFQFMEVRRDPERPHFDPKTYLLPTPVSVGSYLDFELTLETGTYASVWTVPQYINFKMTDPQAKVTSGQISLLSNIFTKELLDELSTWKLPSLNVVVVGPTGNGKSFLINLLATALSKDLSPVVIAQTCSKQGHCTPKKYTRKIGDLIGQDIRLSITDTIGFDPSDNDSYSGGFMKFLLAGVVEEEFMTTQAIAAFSTLFNGALDPTKCAHAVIFLCSQKIAALNEDSPERISINKLRMEITEAGYQPILVISHMDQVVDSDVEEIQDNIQSITGIGGIAPFLVHGYPKSRFRVFESDIEALQILTQVVKNAKVFTTSTFTRAQLDAATKPSGKSNPPTNVKPNDEL